MKAENRHYTRVWKKKRKNYDGDKCHLAKCGICSPHKRIGNSHKLNNKANKISALYISQDEMIINWEIDSKLINKLENEL